MASCHRSWFRLFAALFIALAATAGFAQTSVTLDATSGTGTISTNYTTTGTSGLTLSNGFFAEYLVVGGGGSGGTAGAVASNQNNWGTGGGGAGGMVSGTMQLSATSYTVTVGGGGAAPTYVSGSTSQGNNGANSVFGSVTAFGGGGGGGGENSFSGVGANGGSGGGGGSKYSNAGGTGTDGQGNAGGAARAGDQSSAANRTAGGGGGGAGGGGSAAVSTVAGNGGAGLASTITGTSVTYAGGGGGGAGDTFQTPTAGVGGAGGGGNGGVNTGSAGDGTDGLGGGGGGRGADGAGGRGGSGIVIARYAGASLGAIGGTVSSGSGSAAGYTLHTFTTGSTTTATSALNLSNVDMNARLGTTLTGVISGTGSLTFAGPGRLTLSASNTYTGDTRITSGTLAIGNANAVKNSTLDMNASDSGAITFSQASTIGGLKGSRAIANGGNRLQIGLNNQSTTYSGALSGTGGLTKLGTGTLTLSGSSSFTGDTIVSAGTLAITNANALAGSTLEQSGGKVTFAQASNLGGLKSGTLANGAGNIANGGYTLTIGGNNQSTTYSAQLSGSGGLIKSGNGTLTLENGNTFTGDTRIASGTLAIGWEFALYQSTLDMDASDSGAITFSQASNIGGLKGSRDLANGGKTLTIGGNNASTNFSGSLSGAGGLTKFGTGTLTLSGSNSFTGDTRFYSSFTSGTLAIANVNALAGSTLDTSGGSAFVFLQNSNLGGLKSGGSLDNGGYTLTIGGNNQSTTYSGVLSGAGGLTKNGDGKLTLTGNNTYSGLTTVSTGTLEIGGGTTGSIAGNIANSSVVVFNRSNAATYAGTISGAGSLTKQGAGTLTLSGSSTFTGDTRVASGTLAVGNANALAGSTLDMNASDSGAVTFSQASNIGGITGSRGIDNGGKTLTIGGNNQSTTYEGWIVGSGGLVKTGAGTLTLSGNGYVAPFTGDTRISAGTLAVGSTGAILNFVLGLSTLDMNANDSGVITFNTGAYLGGLKGTRNIDIGSTGLGVGFNGNSTTYSGVLSGSGVLEKVGSGTLTLTGNNTYTGPTGVKKGTLSIGDGGTSGSIASDSVELSKGVRLVFNRSDASTYAGNISGVGSLTKLGAGALTLTGSSSFTGDTTVAAGTLVLGSGNALSSRAAVTVASGATLAATAPIRIGYIDSQGTVVGGENLTATATVTRSGNIGGIANGTDSQGTFAAGIVKLGSGTSTVNAANTYTGLTWVREGTLAVGTANAFAAASDLTVDSGATLDRAGYSQTVTNAIIDGTVGNSATGGLLTVTGTLSGSGLVNGNMLVNGVHTPGNSPGIQTFDGNLSYGSNATINWELIANTASNSPVVFDQIVLTGASNLAFNGANVLALSFAGAGSLVDWNNSFWDVNRAWTVFDLATGVTTGFESLSLGGSLLDSLGNTLSAERGAFSTSLVGQDVVLNYTVTAVPEPATWALALAGLAGGYVLRRRRRA